jgi:hypothetical protein
VNDPVWALVIVKSGVPAAGAMVVGSFAVSLDVLVSPPPATVAKFMTLAGAVADTLTVSVIVGKAVLADSIVFVVQLSATTLQTQPEPLMAVAVSPAGKVSTRVTVPLVTAVPELVTVTL